MKSTFGLLCAAIVVTIGSSLACATSPNWSSKGTEGDTSADKPDFACASKPIDLTPKQLEQLAIAEYEKRGGRIKQAQYEAKIRLKVWEWFVEITLLPAAPGSHFGVVVDGLTGKVKHYIGGS